MSKYAIRGRLKWNEYAWLPISNLAFAKFVLWEGLTDLGYPQFNTPPSAKAPAWLVRLGAVSESGIGTFSFWNFSEGFDIYTEFDVSEEEDLGPMEDEGLNIVEEDYCKSASTGDHECCGQLYLYQEWLHDTNWGRILVDSTLSSANISVAKREDLDLLIPFSTSKSHINYVETCSWESGSWEPNVRIWIGCENCDVTQISEFVLDWSYGERSTASISSKELLEAFECISVKEWSDSDGSSLETAFSNFWEEEGNTEEFLSLKDSLIEMTHKFRNADLALNLREILA